MDRCWQISIAFGACPTFCAPWCQESIEPINLWFWLNAWWRPQGEGTGLILRSLYLFFFFKWSLTSVATCVFLSFRYTKISLENLWKITHTEICQTRSTLIRTEQWRQTREPLFYLTAKNAAIVVIAWQMSMAKGPTNAACVPTFVSCFHSFYSLLSLYLSPHLCS